VLPLALTGQEWIAVAGVTSGAAVGLGGLVFGYFNGRSERAHAKELARSTRMHEQRLITYSELAAFLEHMRMYIVRSEPFMGPKPPPPDPPDDDDQMALSGRVAIAASQEVEEAVKDAMGLVADFREALNVYRQAVQRNAPERPTVRKAMDEARTRADEAITEAQRGMREELAAL
jgi:hypothetical protein